MQSQRRLQRRIKWTSSLQAASTAGPRAGGAAKAMAACGDLAVPQFREGINVPNCFPPRCFDIEHLVKVTVIQFAVPSDAYQRSAHQLIHCRRIEVVHQQTHVALELSIANEEFGEPFDGHVGDGEQPVELDSKTLAQLSLVIGLQLFLSRRKKSTQWVVDEVQQQPRAGSPISKVVELLQRTDTLIKDAFTALLVYIFCRVTWQAGGDLDTVCGKKLDQIFVPWFKKDGQITAINHLPSQIARLHHQPLEIRVQLGCASGDVYNLD